MASQPNGTTRQLDHELCDRGGQRGAERRRTSRVTDGAGGAERLERGGRGRSEASNTGNNVQGTLSSPVNGDADGVVSMSNATRRRAYTKHSQRDRTTPDPTPTNKHRHGDGDRLAPLADVATVVSLPANATAGTVVGLSICSNLGTSTAAVTGSVTTAPVAADQHERDRQHDHTDLLAPGASIQTDLHVHGAGEQRDGHQHGVDHHRQRTTRRATTLATMVTDLAVKLTTSCKVAGRPAGRAGYDDGGP